jgi:diguanylate cyclase (GGDEF)-like protein
MSLLWTVGGLVSLLTTVLPHPDGMNTLVMIMIGVTSPLVAALIWWRQDHLPGWMFPTLLLVGTGIVSTLVLVAGGGSSATSFTFFYTWVVLYAVMFFAPITAALEIAAAGIAYAVVSIVLRGAAGAPMTAVEPVILVGVIGTIAAVVAGLSRARQMTEIDPLTRVANRRGLDRALDSAITRARADSEPLVIAMIDVDHFKQVNDSQGHQAGDRLLERLATTWKHLLRDGDGLARFGGDEFVVVLPGCPADEASTILERLREAAAGVATCSVGATVWQLDETASMVLSRTDFALYEAKRAGRDRTVILTDPNRESNIHTDDQACARTAPLSGPLARHRV